MKKIILLIFSFFISLFRTTSPIPTPVPTPTLSPTPTPTPKPLTFTEMNTLYGPCVYLPTLMYHHVQDLQSAKDKKQVSLTVTTDNFRKQMQYLRDRGYNVTSMQDLINFFDAGTAIPKKSILITFDDGYEDFYTDAYPILKEFGYPATAFTPTGLMNNRGYLSWSQISEMVGNRILFSNHTWSHKNVASAEDVIEREILVADTQLSERGLNLTKVFAYPYGVESKQAIAYLNGLNYKLAFTTRYGSTLCKKQRLDLSRIRIGNSAISSYGL